MDRALRLTEQLENEGSDEVDAFHTEVVEGDVVEEARQETDTIASQLLRTLELFTSAQ